MAESFKVDFHCHPLCHEHYPDLAWQAELTDRDKEYIQKMLDLQIQRGIDAVCITDHNQFSSGIYARELAKSKNLPLKVISGTECTVNIAGREIHVLAVGCEKSFEFDTDKDDLAKLLELIRTYGGLAFLSHPHYYPYVAHHILELFDGYEEYNGTAAHYGCGIYNNEYFKGLRIRGSDFHLDSLIDIMVPKQLEAFAVVDESMGALYELILKA